MTIREAILGLIAGIACIFAVLALQYAGMARKSRDTYKERYDSVKGLLWYVPDEQWETYVNQRLKNPVRSPITRMMGMTRFMLVQLRLRLPVPCDPQAHLRTKADLSTFQTPVDVQPTPYCLG